MVGKIGFNSAGPALMKGSKASVGVMTNFLRHDHRRVGVDLGLFHLDALAPGSPFYLPKGMALYNELVRFIQDLYPKYGYREVLTPQLFRSAVGWE